MDPDAAMPVSPARVFVPNVMLVRTPDPAVGMNHNAPFGVVHVITMDMPALAFGVAGNGGRSARGREREGPQTKNRSGSELRITLHATSPGLDRQDQPVEIQPLTQNAITIC